MDGEKYGWMDWNCYKDIKFHYISMTENLINTTYIILGNSGVIHSVPTAFTNAVGTEWITPWAFTNAVGTEWITPWLQRIHECSWYGMDHALVTEDSRMQLVRNGSRLGYRGFTNAVGTEWITPWLQRIHECSWYGMDHALVREDSRMQWVRNVSRLG